MKHAKYDIDIRQGSEFSWLFTWRIGGEAGTPVNLTSYTARMQVRYSVADSVVALEALSTGVSPRIVLGGAAGTVTVTIPATATTGVTKSGVYDLELVTAGGVVDRSIGGRVNLIKEVTR